MADEDKDTKPIKRYRAGGYGAMVESDTGMWVKVEDVYALAQQVVQLALERMHTRLMAEPDEEEVQ